MTLEDGMKAAEIGVRVIALIIGLIEKALRQDEKAIETLRRVDAVLSPSSPTAEAFERAARIAASKPE